MDSDTKSVNCEKMSQRRQLSNTHLSEPVSSDVEEDDLGSTTGYHNALPLEVHGSGYTQMAMVSNSKAELLSLPCVR